jgi:hypothetical protein
MTTRGEPVSKVRIAFMHLVKLSVPTLNNKFTVVNTIDTLAIGLLKKTYTPISQTYTKQLIQQLEVDASSFRARYFVELRTTLPCVKRF